MGNIMIVLNFMINIIIMDSTSVYNNILNMLTTESKHCISIRNNL